MGLGSAPSLGYHAARPTTKTRRGTSHYSPSWRSRPSLKRKTQMRSRCSGALSRSWMGYWSKRRAYRVHNRVSATRQKEGSTSRTSSIRYLVPKRAPLRWSLLFRASLSVLHTDRRLLSHHVLRSSRSSELLLLPIRARASDQRIERTEFRPALYSNHNTMNSKVATRTSRYVGFRS